MTGPLVEQWPPESQRRLFGEIPVNAYPRPPVAGAPTLEAGATSPLRLSDFKGPGQMLGDERYLNTNGTVTTTVNCPVPGEYEFGVGAYETHAGDEAREDDSDAWRKRDAAREIFGGFATREAKSISSQVSRR